MLHACGVWRVMTPRAALRILALEASSDLTQVAVKKAYIRQTLQCHPDLHPNDPQASEKFRTLSDALRVALTALKTQRTTAPPLQDTEAGGVVCDSQAALEALRRAVVAHYACKETHADSGTAHTHDGADAFFSPNLEHVSRVCHAEAVAMRRVHTFCESLPSVLCGSAAAALFEAVAFFHVRYVQSTAACVMRFSKNLPVIVRRVVQHRKRHVRHRHDRATSGLATGSRPQEQRIEDVAMKPLVLVGALIFNTPHFTTRDVADEVSCNVPGIIHPDDLRVTPELRCVIDPADSIGEIVTKLGRWEGASFERLKLELAIVDVCRLLSGMLGMDEGPTLAVMAHLAHPSDTVRRVLLTLQKLACDLCFHFDENAATDTAPASAEASLRLAELVLGTTPHSRDDAATAQSEGRHTDPATLLTHCRALARRARWTVTGNVELTWSDATNLVQDTHEVGEAAAEDVEPATRARVERHPSCSVAEMVQFAVRVPVDKSPRTFLRELRHALATVVCETARAKHTLVELLPVRDSVVKEEFIAETSTTTTAETRYRHRGPIQCFPRLFNAPAAIELRLWRRLHAVREYLARHAPAMTPVNVYYNCMPYRAGDRGPDVGESGVELSEGGWVREDADGCDSVVLTARELDSDDAFRDWLEAVVECCTLSKEVQRVLSSAGVGYVARDAALPLANYLSFVKLFVQATAVRAVLEHNCHPVPGQRLTEHDVGLTIIVGERCDLREGGKLYVPWFVDPNLLLALLSDSQRPLNLTT